MLWLSFGKAVKQPRSVKTFLEEKSIIPSYLIDLNASLGSSRTRSSGLPATPAVSSRVRYAATPFQLPLPDFYTPNGNSNKVLLSPLQHTPEALNALKIAINNRLKDSVASKYFSCQQEGRGRKKQRVRDLAAVPGEVKVKWSDQLLHVVEEICGKFDPEDIMKQHPELYDLLLSTVISDNLLIRQQVKDPSVEEQRACFGRLNIQQDCSRRRR